jgi:hypothetical protein
MPRPRKEIDQKIFEGLCALQCTEEEIADAFDTSTDTVARWCKRVYGKSFADVFREKRSKGRVSLRRSQFKLAEKSATMAIWLGKQYLGQRDNIDVNVTETDGIALDELEKMVLNDDTATSDSTADT